MGHVEPGGEAGSAPAELEPPIWPLWRRVRSQFSTWRLIKGGLLSPVGWGVYGVDFISGLRRGESARAVLALIRGTSDGDLEALTRLAQVNAFRNEQMFRFVALMYVTVPLTIVLTLAEIAPDAVQDWMREQERLLLLVFAGSVLFMVYYLGALWRARQVVNVLELAAVERGLASVAPYPEQP